MRYYLNTIFRYHCDMSEQLREILNLSIPERILLVEAIWDSIAEENNHSGFTDAQKSILSDRLKRYKENPQGLLSWEEVKHSLK